MHRLLIILVAAGLFVPPSAWADALAPGKPAGVHQAQMGDKEWMVLGGIGIVAVTIIAVTTSGSSAAAPVTQPVIVVTTSATTP